MQKNKYAHQDKQIPFLPYITVFEIQKYRETQVCFPLIASQLTAQTYSTVLSDYLAKQPYNWVKIHKKDKSALICLLDSHLIRKHLQ